MRNIPDPGFSGDSGATDPVVGEARSADAGVPDRVHRPTLAGVPGSRVRVPVGPGLLGRIIDPLGLAHDKTSDMAAVLMRGRDGRLALLAFTGTSALQQWDPQARPVPVPMAQAAQAALNDDSAALVLDVAGPVRFVVEGEDLRALAEGYVLVELEGRYAWVRSQDRGGRA